jgi:histidyl-tRNA synthetase
MKITVCSQQTKDIKPVILRSSLFFRVNSTRKDRIQQLAIRNIKSIHTFAQENYNCKLMPSETPSIPKGTRDFSPQEMIRRNYIFHHIQAVFEKYGYVPIETPAMENLTTLLGKYGEEGDRLLFKILNSGNFLSKVSHEELQERNTGALTSKMSEKGLRYDLTVPFARFVVQHRNDISFPFKRYQVQPVWRADRPQKGRYREFTQCDVDVIGSDSLLNEVELVQIIDEVFTRLDIRVSIRLNNRKILAGISEQLELPDKFQDITIAIDKLDKIGREGVRNELLEKGIPEKACDSLDEMLDIGGTANEKIHKLKGIVTNETGRNGLNEMSEIFDLLETLSIREPVEFDLTLARGLNYYTGTIFEVMARETEMSSICGGGRYDDLTGIFGMPGTSGVGISFGADRVYDVLNALQRFPEGITATTQVLLVNFGEKEQRYCLGVIEKLRGENISAELYPDSDKLKKQMKYADQKRIPFVVLIGENEMQDGVLTMKDMSTGNQETLVLEEFIRKIKSTPN